MKLFKAAVLGAALVASLATSAQAQTATFDPLTNILRVPSIQVGPTIYNNLVYRADSGAILSLDQAGAATERCTFDNVTPAKYAAVQTGMTLDQVNALMGCKFHPSLVVRSPVAILYTWLEWSGRAISVYFDPTGSVVFPLAGGTTFKQSAGF